MTPLQVLVAATKNGAFACGKSEELGTIEPGKSADILVVNGNPLDDLHRLQDVRMVIKNGLTIRDEENNSALACLTSASSGRRELDSSHRA